MSSLFDSHPILKHLIKILIICVFGVAFILVIYFINTRSIVDACNGSFGIFAILFGIGSWTIIVNFGTFDALNYAFANMDQYFSWLTNIFTKWDWGTSTNVSIGQSAMVIILERLPVTIEINLITSAIAVPVGFLLGIWAALKKNKMTDNIISTVIVVFISVPSFIIITFSIMILAYQLKWLPSQWPSVQASSQLRAAGFVIPVFALSAGTICAYARWVRAELTDVMESEFLLLARTKGLTRSQAIVRHALRNSLVPIFPMLIGEIIGALSGSMVLEQLYGIPGIGTLYITALGTPGKTTDYNVLMVDMALVTMMFLFKSIKANALV